MEQLLQYLVEKVVIILFQQTIQANFDSIGNDGERVRTMIYKNGSIIFRNVYYDQSTDI